MEFFYQNQNSLISENIKWLKIFESLNSIKKKLHDSLIDQYLLYKQVSEINKEIAYNESETIQGEVVVDNVSSALIGFTKVLNGKLDYFLDGYALIALKGREIKIPIKQKFRVEPFSRKITILKDYEWK